MISVLRSAVFLYSAPPSVVPIAARPIDSPDSGPAAFQMPCTAPFTDNLYALPVRFRRRAQAVPAENAFKTALGPSSFSREGKAESRLPHGAGKGIRAMHSSHFIVARHIQEYKKIFLFPDAVLSILFHSTGRRSPGTEGFSASAKDPGLQKRNRPPWTGSLFVKFTGFQCTIVPQRKEVCKTGYPHFTRQRARARRRPAGNIQRTIPRGEKIAYTTSTPTSTIAAMTQRYFQGVRSTA